VAGKIVKSGDFSLAQEIEATGYDPILEELGVAQGEAVTA
jgi:Fe-S cluster assembly ATPase SufC